ncbi:UDP-glucose dehydrogenase family protein [Nocardia wallacei]|uniref:UDP-glucose dehydrogenase family protein n=1 Tax=Nocardia wallacei TaxID=480035 RepID=UPI00245442BF|nr:nucleotide sugar dehydrogenase [Nocardia wallacei]
MRYLVGGHTALREPDLAAQLHHGLTTGRLRFHTTLDTATEAQIVVLCLPTPALFDGSADLTAILQCVATLRSTLRPGTVIIIKSTVPIGTHAHVTKTLARQDIPVVSNPEFLREGHAVYDFLHPARIVLGSRDPAAAKLIASLYAPIRTETIITTPESAELAKYAANAFLATKLSFINSLADLCDAVTADISDVAHILGADPRIGAEHLRPGPGWGGPCLPKDIAALTHQARTAGLPMPLLDAALTANTQHRLRIVDRLRAELGDLRGRRIAVLGLTFKTGTNDHRQSPALHIAQHFLRHGTHITAHDPATPPPDIDGLQYTDDPYRATEGADATVVLTDWPEYQQLDWHRVATTMSGRIVFDTRNYLDLKTLRQAALRHIQLGRPAVRDERNLQPTPLFQR